MGSFNFWQKWLVGVGIFLTVFGIVLSLFPQSRVMDILFNNQIDPVFWEGGKVPPAAYSFQAWIYGVLGSVVAGWGILVIFVAHHPFRFREKWAWTCLSACIVIWFLFDTTLSAMHHAWFNAGFNTFLLLVIVIPLAFTRKHFKS